jgi:uncharacterized protein involved in exopolysaccharide biosynthesis
MFFSVLLLAALVAGLLPAHYRASATLAVLPSPEFTVRPDAGSRDQAANPLAMDQIMKAETEILGSDDLHLATLQRLGAEALYPGSSPQADRRGIARVVHGVLHAIASLWIPTASDRQAQALERQLHLFANDLLILPAKDSNIITVTYSNRDPVLAAGAVNTMLTLYAAKRRALYDDPQLEVVRRETAGLAVAALDADRALASFKRTHAITDFEAQRGLLLGRKNAADQAVADATLSVAEQSARIQTLDRELSREPETIGVFTEQDHDTRMQTAEAALQDLRTRLAGAAERYRDGSRLMRELRAQLAAREGELERMASAPATSVIRRGHNPDLDTLRLDRLHALAELVAARARLETLSDQQATLTQALKDCEANDAALQTLQREKLAADDNLRSASRLVSERHLTEAEDALRLANVRVIQSARVPQAATPLPFFVVAAGVLFGGLFAAAWLVAVFLARGVFLTEEGLEQALDLPVLASFQFFEENNQEAVLLS